MIINFERFMNTESPYWDELDKTLQKMNVDIVPGGRIEDAKRFHYLYQRASSDLAQLAAYPNEPAVRQRLETLVAEAYAEIHETREQTFRFDPARWCFETFPQTFRQYRRTFALVVAITLAGCFVGALALYMNNDNKSIILPFSHLQGKPSDRVAYEEAHHQDRMSGAHPQFAASLMTHNIRVSLFVLALGMTLGVGTIILLFYNGVILGAVVYDYCLDGQGTFVLAWLLPHGIIEIPAILIAGQAGLILGRAMIGRGDSTPFRYRLRLVRDDILTLITGAALLLVWAGIIESFLSQYHAPIMPYWVKITFGMIECGLLITYLTWGGRKVKYA